MPDAALGNRGKLTLVETFRHESASEALRAAMEESADLGARVAFDGLERAGVELAFDYNLTHAFALDYVENNWYLVDKEITDTTRRRLRRALIEWVEEPTTFPHLVQRFTQIVNDPARAEIIAATEVTRAFAEGTHRCYIQAAQAMLVHGAGRASLSDLRPYTAQL